MSNVQPTNNATVIYLPPANRVAAPSEDPGAEKLDDQVANPDAPSTGDKPSESPTVGQADAIAGTSALFDGIDGYDRVTRPVDDDMAPHDVVLSPSTTPWEGSSSRRNTGGVSAVRYRANTHEGP